VKRLLWVAIAMAVLFGVCALAVETFDDRETLVSPPDAVAEGFTREVLTKRWDRASEYLAEPVSTERLRELHAALGESDEVEAEIVSRTDEQALVNVRLQDTSVSYSLEFEQEWKIVLQ